MFFAGLDHSLNRISCVLATSPLSSLEETYLLIHCNVQRQVTMGVYEALGLIIHKNNLRRAT